MTLSNRTDDRPRPLRVLVVGGGPAGLLFATTLKTYLGRDAHVVVREKRWVAQGDSVRWRVASESNVRRDQVVTLQSAVLDALPATVLDAILPAGSFSHVWPVGPDSPVRLGRPRNVRIRDLEDRLLYHAKKVAVLLEAVDASVADVAYEVGERAWDLVAIADGPRSKVREHFIRHFGKADPAPFQLRECGAENDAEGEDGDDCGDEVEEKSEQEEKDGTDEQGENKRAKKNGVNTSDVGPLTDVVLGLRVKIGIPEPDAVALTIAQQRFLYNGHKGDGYVYMRLTRAEADEVRGRRADGTFVPNCIQSQPCVMRLGEPGRPACTRHATEFVPAHDESSALMRRVREAVRLFRCAELKWVTAFRLSMALRPGFVAELSAMAPRGSHMRQTFGALVGDAANTIHFWPGRGLNHAILSAAALARVACSAAQAQWRRLRAAGRPLDARLRAADFTRFQALMAALQWRHKDRAWRNMVTCDALGRVRAIADVMAAAGARARDGADGEARRDEALRVLGARVDNAVARLLPPRLEQGASASAIKNRVRLACSAATVQMMAAGGGWETQLSGGDEVVLDDYVRVPQVPVSSA